ncbi:MAG: hypothetical protein SFZ03_07395 [Candidatus Melainabacteria bacterium]|nr:hypothetical protein [Candidatus Melainabacteria bacterium]
MTAKINLKAVTRRVFTNPKVLLLVGGIGCILYMIDYDMLIRPSLEKLGQLDNQLRQQEDQLEERRNERNTFTQLSDELKNLQTDTPVLASGESPTVAAATHSKHIIDLASGKQPLSLGQPLPGPHNVLEFVTIEPQPPKSVNVLDKAITTLAPDIMLPGGATLPMWQNDYNLKLRGTYAGLLDFLNELVNLPDLVVLRRVEFTPLAEGATTKLPRPTALPPVLAPTASGMAFPPKALPGTPEAKSASGGAPSVATGTPQAAGTAQTGATQAGAGQDAAASGAATALPGEDAAQKNGEKPPFTPGPAALVELTLTFSIYLYDASSAPAS